MNDPPYTQASGMLYAMMQASKALSYTAAINLLTCLHQQFEQADTVLHIVGPASSSLNSAAH